MKNYKNDGSFLGQSSAIKKELMAIEESKLEVESKVEGEVINTYNYKILRSFKKILYKITKASN